MSYFEVFKYSDNLYQLKDKLGVLATLVIGKDKALLLDTAYGIGNLKEEVENITKLPLIVVDSHGHMDHASGNYQFEEVYIHPQDIDLCKNHNDITYREKNVATAKRLNALPLNFDEALYLSQKEGNLKPLAYGQVFDLGGISLEVVNMIGHTQGSIGLYSKELKLMLVGDATCPFVWLFLDESAPLHVYTEMLERVLKIDFDNFLVGHGARLFPKSKMYDFYNIAKNYDLSKTVKVDFGKNSYCYTLGKMYDQNDCGIVYDINKL